MLSESTSVIIDTSKRIDSGSALTDAIAGEDSLINKILSNINNVNIQCSISSNDEIISNENIYYDSSIEKYAIKYIAYVTTSTFTITLSVRNQVYSMNLKNNIPSNHKSIYLILF